MFDSVKKYIEKKLMEEISCLDASTLEIVAENVISYLESKRLIHHGINKDYKPVKSTIDAFSDHSTIAVESSTDEKYFEATLKKHDHKNHYEKIENDIYHAINHKPPEGPEKIYLVTNQEEQPSFRSDFNQTPIFTQYGSKIIIYDSRELAKLVYEQSVANTRIFDFYRQAFPDFARNMDNYEYYGKVPSFCANHVKAPAATEAIDANFRNGNKICVLYGVSGTGKTQTVIEYVHENHKSYENILWLSGDDWKKDTSLASIQRTRGGLPINVAGIFNSQKTLLVIDSLERVLDNPVFDELQDGFERGGKIIITSQLSKNGDDRYFPMPVHSRDIALSILGEKETSISENGKKVIQICGASPLILSTIYNLVEKEGIDREELYVEIINSPEKVTDDNGISIVKKILSNLEHQTLEAFRKIANSASAYHDSEFLVHFIGGMNRSNLQKLSLLLPSNTPGIIKAHDLLIQSVKDSSDYVDFTAKIESYIDKHNGGMTPSVFREIHLCYSQLCEENTRRGNRYPDWITYALVQVEGETKDEICKLIFQNDLTPDLPLSAVMSIIDAKEAHAYTLEGEKRNEYYQECSAEYKKAYEIAVDASVRLEYLHHYGKALRRCGNYDEALKTFNIILEEKPDSYATWGQLAHLGAQRTAPVHIKNAGEDAIKKLLQFILNNKSKVPLRVSLAMFARLRSYWNVSKDVSKNKHHIAKLAEIIAISGLDGFGQFYEAYVSFTSMFCFEHSDVTISLTEEMPVIFMQTPSSVEETQWLSACESLVNTANAAKNSGKQALFEKLKDSAILFANRIAEKHELMNYEGRVLAKTYLVFGYPEKSLLVIEKVKKEELNHWIMYQKAKAELELANADQALKDIKVALEQAFIDPAAKKNLAAYYDLHSHCLERKGELNTAIEEIQKAISSTSSLKYKETLEKHKAEMESRL